MRPPRGIRRSQQGGGGAERLAVSLDASAVPADPVGAGRYTMALATALGRREDIDLAVWCRRDDAARWTSTGATVVARAPSSRPARLAWEQVGLPLGLARGRAVVHHGPHYTMPVLCPVPAVVTVHDLTFVDHPEWHERSKVLVFQRAIALARHRAAAIVCVSEATARRLQALGGARGPVFVAPHGVDHARFRPEEPSPGADAAVLVGLGVRAPYLLFLGTIEPRKQVDVLVHAFSVVAGRHPDLTLVLAGGTGWGRDAVGPAIAASPFGHRVVRTGYVPEDAVPALLRRSATVCYPAAEEGFGLPALEAVACGAPLVTTTGSVMAELVGGSALTAPAGDVVALAAAIERSLAGGADAEHRRRLGLVVAAEHTWEASARRHVAAYRAAAAATSRRADPARATPAEDSQP